MKALIILGMLSACHAPDAQTTGDAAPGSDADASVTGSKCRITGFPTPPLLETSANPTSVMIADLDGDGIRDLIVAADHVDIFSGLGGGAFGDRLVTLERKASSLAVSDIDHDGHADLVFTDGTSVVVTRGLGNRMFDAGKVYSAGTAPSDVAVADLNNDGKPDVVAASGSAGQVYVLLNQGDGTLASATTYSLPTGSTNASIAIADLNGDQHPDIVVANTAKNLVEVMLGSANGTFGAPQDFTTATGPVHPAVGDLDQDGHLDVVVATQGGLSVLRGGTPLLGTHVEQGDPTGYRRFQLVDMNGDDKLDAAAIPVSGKLETLLGIGNGTFRAPAMLAVTADDVATADLDNNGTADLAIVNTQASTAAAVLATADLSFALPSPLALGGPAIVVHSADVNSDGLLDIGVLISTPPELDLFVSVGNGAFAAPKRIPLVGAKDFVFANLDADNNVDVAYSDGTTIHVLAGSISGDFTETPAAGRSRARSATTRMNEGGVANFGSGAQIFAADIDEDGLVDVVTVSIDTISVYRNLGADKLADPVNYFISHDRGRLAFLDVNGDHHVDIVFADLDGLESLTNDGTGAFTEVRQLYGSQSLSLDAAILDGSQILAATSVGIVQVKDGNAELLVPPFDASAAEFQDVDADGRPDLLAISRGNLDVATRVDSSFEDPEKFGVEGNVFAVGDFSGDSIPDIAVGSTSGLYIHQQICREMP